MKALVGAFNQEKALSRGPFSVIVKTDGLFAALVISPQMETLEPLPVCHCQQSFSEQKLELEAVFEVFI